MGCINCGQLDIKFLIPISGGVVRLIYNYIIVLNEKYEALGINPFLVSIYTYIGMILAFIPYLIFKYRTKHVVINSNNPDELKDKSKLNVELIFNNDILKKTKCSKYKCIVIASFFDFINTLLYGVLYTNIFYNLWIFDIIFISLFSHIILNTKLYKHQYTSMIIILILGFALNIIEYFKLEGSENRFDYIGIIVKFLTEIFFSLAIVIIKYNLEKNYCSPYEICIWEGILGLIFHLICLVVINCLELTIDGIEYPKNIKYYFENYNYNDFIESLIVIITGGLYNISLILTCNYFSPSHILIASIIKEYHLYLQKGGNVILNIMGFFILFIILFIFLVFVEVIELNICNISYNTKKNIERRSKMDSYVDSFDENLNEESKEDEEDIMNSSSSTNNENL